ncbi:hypothetical protein JCM6882_008703 [Rhodosporidiobolus microsporus]
MPALINTPLEARINFSVPPCEISEADKAKYLATYSAEDPVPTRESVIPLFDLREELESGFGGLSAEELLDERGFAAAVHASEHGTVENLSSVEGTEKYLEESKELFRTLLGATKVIAWNSVIRANDESGIPDVKQTQQQKVEEAKPPSSHIKATAGFAHVDQDDVYARTIIKRAAGDDVFERYSRLQIINLWRPLRERVTNRPLAVSDFRTMNLEEDIFRMAGSYGTAYSVAHSPNQRWSYISHQKPSEVLMLRCYDSNMGKNGEALFSGHVACDVLNEPKLEGVKEVPRMSVEVRLIVLHE